MVGGARRKKIEIKKRLINTDKLCSNYVERTRIKQKDRVKTRRKRKNPQKDHNEKEKL